jgi:hypothetical protein
VAQGNPEAPDAVRLRVPSTAPRRLMGVLMLLPAAAFIALIGAMVIDTLRAGNPGLALLGFAGALIFPGLLLVPFTMQALRYFRRTDTLSVNGHFLVFSMASGWGDRPKTFEFDLRRFTDPHVRLHGFERDSRQSDYRPSISGRLVWGDEHSPSLVFGVALTVEEAIAAAAAVNRLIDGYLAAERQV